LPEIRRFLAIEFARCRGTIYCLRQGESSLTQTGFYVNDHLLGNGATDRRIAQQQIPLQDRVAKLITQMLFVGSNPERATTGYLAIPFFTCSTQVFKQQPVTQLMIRRLRGNSSSHALNLPTTIRLAAFVG